MAPNFNSRQTPASDKPSDTSSDAASRAAADDTTEFMLLDETRAQFDRKLPPPPPIQVAGLSDRGKVRAANEDHFLVARRRRETTVISTNLKAEEYANTLDDVYVLAVADGLGGHSHGELASAMTLRAGGARSGASWLIDVAESGLIGITKRFEAGARAIHELILSHSRRDPQTRGMASTLTAALINGYDVYVGHVGDSRAYLLRGGVLEQLTQDHTLAQDLARAGFGGSPSPRQRHVLTNCLGGDEGHVRVDSREFRWGRGDTLMLCSDGLSDRMTDAELTDALRSRASCEEICQHLFQLAMDQGGRDNITVVVARLGD